MGTKEPIPPPLINMSLSLNIKPIKELHCSSILQDLCDLRPRRDQLQNIPIILDGSGRVFRGMSHLQGILQDSHQLFDLAIVQDSCGNAAFSG